MSWYLEVMKKYFVFSGRARRKEYWMFFLFSNLIELVARLIDTFVFYNIDKEGHQVGILTSIIFLFHLIPYLTVSVRRLHDIGKTGWWLLISLVPLVGGIILLIFTCLKSEAQENKYGQNPKANLQ